MEKEKLKYINFKIHNISWAIVCFVVLWLIFEESLKIMSKPSTFAFFAGLFCVIGCLSLFVFVFYNHIWNLKNRYLKIEKENSDKINNNKDNEPHEANS